MASLREILSSKIGKDAEKTAAQMAIEVKVGESQAQWGLERARLFSASVKANNQLAAIEATDSTFSDVMDARQYAKECTDRLAAFDALYSERFPA